MIELVINAPHLQTRGQRFSTALLSLSGWLLWGYFLLPLLILCGWWFGVQVCGFWVNLCGGYPGLHKLLTLYGWTVLGLTSGWILWVAFDTWLHRQAGTRHHPTVVVDSSELSHYFSQPEDLLIRCRDSRITTVHFDSEGRITDLNPH